MRANDNGVLQFIDGIVNSEEYVNEMKPLLKRSQTAKLEHDKYERHSRKKTTEFMPR